MDQETLAVTLAVAEKVYGGLKQRVDAARRRLGRPLTLTEKILFSHLREWPNSIERGSSQLKLAPDRVAMQDATAQMALLQFIVTGRGTVAVPTTVHCDHLIQARIGASSDLDRALRDNQEVYDFLLSASRKFGIGFWKPGSGIIHQVILEQYAFPGLLMIGTDSHTPNAGGLGMLAIGVGGADAVDVMADQPWTLQAPRLLGVHLTGTLSGWASPKDVILRLAGRLTVKGGTGKILEYFGPGTNSISCTGKATITNMGAELGATTSVFPFDERMVRYLESTERSEIAKLANGRSAELTADPEVLADPEKFYDEIIEINLSELTPQWVGPHAPDLLRKVSEMKQAVQEHGYPNTISYALIGSCTNSSYEDISRAVNVARQAAAKGLKTKIPLLITPGSDQVFRTIQRDGMLETFEQVGATVLANACGPCIGQWKRDDIRSGQKNTIITSYNRNFARRNDGNADTLAFISSPEVVTAVAFAGELSFDPTKDSIPLNGGFTFAAPSGEELPGNGFVMSREGLVNPPASVEERRAVQVAISPSSERLSFLESFAPWDGKDMLNLVVLLKAKGKCTTDHISQAGPWLKYRGHLARISENCFLGAANAFTGETGQGTNALTGEKGVSFPDLGKYYKAHAQGWVTIGDENYGEGSSREHAAMSPRYLGCRAIIAKSFARIHETNLKKQGVLPLTFANPADYDKIPEDARLDIVGLNGFSPESALSLKVTSGAGAAEIPLKHSMTAEQIEWLRAGSALNVLKPQ